jgi:tetratricopeptide (TPR) repeat protein
LLGAAAAEVEAQLARLAEREILVRAGAEYAFPSALARDAAYATLTGADRALGHRLAGEHLERTGSGEAPAVAEHFRLGGAPARAVPWYARAAEQALEAGDLDAALRAVASGVACGAAGADLGALRVVEAEASVWHGAFDLAVARGTEAAGLFPPGSPSWFRALTHVVMAEGKRGNVDAVQAWVEPALAAGAEASSAQLACLNRIAGHLTFGGRYAAADALLAQIDRLTGDLGARGPHDVALHHEVRAIRATVGGDLGAGLAGFRAALAAYGQAGDRRNACTLRGSLGYVLTELGDFAAAEEALRAVLAVSERMGLSDLHTNALQNLGRVLAYRGEIAEARAVEQRALDAYVASGDPRLAGFSRLYLAQIALLAGDASAAAREARAVAEEAQAASPLRANALALLARALLAEGRAAEAEAPAREAYAQLAADGSLEEGEAMVRLAHAEVLAARGAGEELSAVTAAARDRLLERAAKISDPAWRRRFLEAVPENARLLALAGGAGPRSD